MGRVKYFIMTVFFILFFTFIFLLWTDNWDLEFLKHHLSGENKGMHRMQSLYEASLIILTFLIACVAWYQLHAIFGIKQAEFLIRIDERLGDQSIIKAREIIHSYYKESQSINQESSEKEHWDYIASKINDLGNNANSADVISTRKYICLLNFLDFLETVSVFEKNGYLPIKMANELMGSSLVFFYKIFKKRIEERREKYNDETYYENFERLSKKIKCRKNRRFFICVKCYFNCH